MNWKPITEIPENDNWVLAKGIKDGKVIITFGVFIDGKYEDLNLSMCSCHPMVFYIGENAIADYVEWYDEIRPEKCILNKNITHWAYIKDLFKDE